MEYRLVHTQLYMVDSSNVLVELKTQPDKPSTDRAADPDSASSTRESDAPTPDLVP